MTLRFNKRTAYITEFYLVPSAGGTEAEVRTTLADANVTGTVYYVVCPAAAAAPNRAQIKAGTNGSGGAATWSGSVAGASAAAFTGPATSLTPSAGYVGYAVWDNGILYSDVFSFAFTAAALSGLSNLVITPQTGGKKAAITFDCSFKSGDLSAIVLASGADEPTELQIETYAANWLANRSGPALWAAAHKLSPVDDYTPVDMDLVQNTTYDFYTVARKTIPVGDYTNILSGSFTMLDSAPLLTNIAVAAYSPTSMVIGVDTDDPLGSLKFASFPSATTPSKSNILNGTGGAVDYESVSVSGIGTYGVLMTGLTANTSYKGHVYGIDATPNEGDIVSSIALTTPASETSLFQMLNAGVTTGASISANLTSSTAQADPFGGSNAVAFTATPSGSAINCTIGKNTTNFVDGTMKVRFCVKKGAWASAQAWTRFGMQNVDAAAASLVNFNLDTGAFASVGARVLNAKSVKLGNGWWFVSFDIDLNTKAGADDVNGNAVIWLASASSNNSIATSGAHTIYLYDFRGSY